MQNSGTVSVGNSSYYYNDYHSSILVGADGLTLDGAGGVVSLSSLNYYTDYDAYYYGYMAAILSSGAAATLTNASDTIQGDGQIGDSFLTVLNEADGTINANVSGWVLTLASAAEFDNYGIAEATNGGVLQLGGSGEWTNEAGGAIEASNGGVLQLGGSGEWTNEAGGTVEATNGGVLNLTVNGPVNNAGLISLDDATLALYGSLTLEDLGAAAYDPTTGDTTTHLVAVGSAVDLYGTLTLDTLDPSISPASVGFGDTLDATQGAFANLTLGDGAVIDGGTVIASAAAGGPTGVLSVAPGATATIHDALVVNAGTLTINGAQTFVFDGTLDNSGAVSLVGYYNCGAYYAVLAVGADGAAFQGGGVVILNNNSGIAEIVSDGAATTLTNVDNTIEGAGVIGDGYLSVVNQSAGVIDANLSAQTLTLAPQGLFDNQGLAEATNGGVLQIGGGGGSWTNEADGAIVADDATVSLNGAWVNYGAITSENGGTLSLNIDGALVNPGTIEVDDAALSLYGAMTLEDLGAFSYSAATGDAIANFTIANPTSLVLYGALTLDTIDGTISPASVGFGDTLDATQGAFANLTLGNGAVIDGGTVIAGAAASGPAGVLSIAPGATATIHDAVLINAGQFTLAGGDNRNIALVLDGELQNSGTFSIASDANGGCASTLLVGADGLALVGGGAVELTTTNYYECNSSSIVSNGVATTLTNVDNTIEGAGVVGDGYLSVVNQTAGVIDADTSGQTLTLAPQGLFDNYGLAEATDGGTLSIGGGGADWTNESGATISVDDATLVLNGPFTNDGAITATNSTVYIDGAFDDAMGSLTLDDSTLVIEGQASLAEYANVSRSGGAVTLSGTLSLNGGTLDTTQGLFQGLTLSGGTIDPGTVIDGAGGTLNFTGNGGNLLANVTVIGEDPTGGMVVNASGYVTLSDDAIEGGLTLGNYAFADLTGGTRVLDATGTNPSTISVGYGAAVELNGYGDIVNTITLADGALYLDGAVSASSPLNTDDGDLPGGSADPNWTVEGNPAAVISAGNLHPYWAPDSATSGWIGVYDSTYQPPSPYTFTTTFDVADPSSTILAGLFSIDDQGSISLNPT